ncbi:hypothetical protein LTR09_002986 [Extremus antarcticus]|uniref:Uncharacterized protein n=1 Tax=Extremus antarcticus TaxID=702011 RepID=A0AAJ0LUX3_9PEZI|nr:hypothetical protein LTR09_002986 [Extremus antarcticus]
MLAGLVTLIFLLLGLYPWLSYQQIPRDLVSQPIKPCGTSPSEARRLGCQFDPMEYSWLPPPCYDAELVEDYLRLLERKTLNFYAKPDNDSVANIVPLAEILAGEHHTVYMTWDQHQEHCAYMFRKLHGALDAGGPVDGYIWAYKHTQHCLVILFDRSSDLVGLD